MPRYFFDVTNSNTLGKNSNLFKPREDMLWQRSRHQLPRALVGHFISVINEGGVVIFKTPL
jgi:hypothetical protein